MYKVACDLAQRRARQFWLKDLQRPGFEELPVEQQLENVVASRKRLQQALETYPKGHSQRTSIGGLISELDAHVRDLRSKLPAKAPRDLSHLIVDVAKEMLSPYQFRLLVNEARRRAESAEVESLH